MSLRRELVTELIAALREDQALRTELAGVLRDELRQTAEAADVGLLTIRAYAHRNAIGESTVRNAIREGRLDCRRIGRSVRVAADARITSKRIAGADASSVTQRAAARLGLVQGGRR